MQRALILKPLVALAKINMISAEHSLSKRTLRVDHAGISLDAFTQAGHGMPVAKQHGGGRKGPVDVLPPT